MQDYGNKEDMSAFGFVGLMCVPAYPMFVFSISQATQIDWTPIISTLVPMLVGIAVGNLDRNMAKFLTPAIPVFMPFMGWAFGSGINLIDATKSGFQGVLLTIIFYIIILPALIYGERIINKGNGISALAMTSIAGMSVSVPSLIALSNTAYEPFTQSATAQVAFGVVISSIVTPFLAKKLADKEGIEKNL